MLLSCGDALIDFLPAKYRGEPSAFPLQVGYAFADHLHTVGMHLLAQRYLDDQPLKAIAEAAGSSKTSAGRSRSPSRVLSKRRKVVRAVS